MNPHDLDRLFRNAAAHAQHLIERISSELEFGRRLCDLAPEKANAWRPLLDSARDLVSAVLNERRLDAVAAAVAEAEKVLAPLGRAAKTYTIHLVGHAHIDMNWMWSWPETVSVTVDTFSTVLRLMEAYPEFRFSQSQASTYEAVERLRPDLFQAIQARVAEGRWEVLASHWVEGDKNMASAESLCRHLLLTRAYFKDRFGLEPRDVPIDWSPDTFGHPATMPVYLVDGGVKYLYLHRPGIQTLEKPGAWWWEGPDGSRVLVRNDMALGYNGVVAPETLVPRSADFYRFTGGRDFMFVYGVGDHGGGPTRRDILRGADMATWPIFPNVKFSAAKRFFERLEKQSGRLPVLGGEFNTEFTGCYTTESLIKRANRVAENRLVDTEQARTWAWLGDGLPYPQALLEEAWRDTLFTHFHDILPGSGVHDTRTYAHGQFQKTMATLGTLETEALRCLAARVDTRSAGDDAPPDLPPSRMSSSLGAGVGFRSAEGAVPQSDQSAGQGPRPLVIFNPTGQVRSEVVEATLWDHALPGSLPFKDRTFSIRQADGTRIPAQAIRRGRYWGHEYQEIAFPVKVPAFGYTLAFVVEDDMPRGATAGLVRQLGWTHPCDYAPTERSIEGLENEWLRLELDPTSGGIRRLLDKRTGREVVHPTPLLEYATEPPHAFSAWSADHTGPCEPLGVTAIRRSGDGPHRASIEVDLRIRESNLTLTYTLASGDPRLHIQLKGVWFQRGTREAGVPVLRLALPIAIEEARGCYEIPFGSVDRERNLGEEVPALQWAAVTGRNGDVEAGLLLANDCKYGHSLTGSTLRATLIRSSYEPDILPEIGQHEMRFTLRPLDGGTRPESAIHEGAMLNHPLRVVGTDVHAGPWPASVSLLEVKPSPAVICGVKRSESGGALVVRAFNPSAAPATLTLRPHGKLLGKVRTVRELDLLERPAKPSSARLRGSWAQVHVPSRGVATMLLRI